MNNHIYKCLFSGLMLSAMVGCASNYGQSVASADDNSASVDNRFQAYSSQAFAQQEGTIKDIKNINHYVRGLMHQLMGNVKYVNDTTPIAVTSFVMLDSDLQETNLVGNQIAESFVHEVHKFGLPVVDFKATDFFRISNEGDYIFSRDYMELRTDIPVDYVLSGTMTKHQKGYLINARIVGMKSKAVVASAQGLIPNYVIKSIQTTQNNDGMPLRQGL